jgi:hypothetical protein
VSQVFLSYCLRDDREAAVIRNELRQCGLNVWWDGELPPGKKWAKEVGRALDQSDSMVVLVSPQAMASDLVKRELEHAITNENYCHRLFPVIIEPTAQVPAYFSLLPVFDITKNRGRGLKKLVKAIHKSKPTIK